MKKKLIAILLTATMVFTLASVSLADSNSASYSDNYMYAYVQNEFQAGHSATCKARFTTDATQLTAQAVEATNYVTAYLEVELYQETGDGLIDAGVVTRTGEKVLAENTDSVATYTASTGFVAGSSRGSGYYSYFGTRIYTNWL